MDSDLDLCNVHIRVRQSRESQLEQVGVVHASDLPLGECLYPILAASWSWATWRFPPAAAEDGASSGEPINDASHQPKDPLQGSAGL